MLNVVMLAGIVEAIQAPRQYTTPIRLKVWDYGRDGRRFDTTIFVDVPNEKAATAVVGQYLSVRGKYQRRSYEKNGQKIWVNEIRVFEAIGNQPGTQQEGGYNREAMPQQQPPQQTQQPQQAMAPQPVQQQTQHQMPSDDDIPF